MAMVTKYKRSDGVENGTRGASWMHSASYNNNNNNNDDDVKDDEKCTPPHCGGDDIQKFSLLYTVHTITCWYS